MVEQTHSVVGDIGRGRHRTLEHDTPEQPLEHLDEKVDLVISDHEVVLADLESRIQHALHRTGFTQPVGATQAPAIARRQWDPKEVHVDEQVLADRRERQRVLREMRPELVRPVLDPPFITRVGVLYVPPEFDQAKGIDRHADVVLVRSGYRSLESFLSGSDTRIATLTGLTLGQVAAAKRDLDLAVVLGIGRFAADLLRAVGVQSVSRLARSDPVALHAALQRLHAKHRFFDFPSVLATEDAVARLVSEAQVGA